MKILFVGNSASMMLNFRGDIIKALQRDGCDIEILVPKGDCFDDLSALGIAVHTIPLNPGKKNPLSDIRLFFSLCFFYWKLKPSLIFHYTVKPNLYGSLAAKLLRVKSVAVVSGLGYTFMNKSLLLAFIRPLIRKAIRQSSKVWFLNQSDAQIFFHKGSMSSKKVQVIPGEGINLGHYAPSNQQFNGQKIVFLMIARMLKDKGVQEFIHAAQQVKALYPDTVFQLLGDCDSENPTSIPHHQLLEWQEKGIIEYLGVTNDVRPYIAAADCIVLPSYREGLSRALLEGAAMAKPLIVTDVPGCRELVLKDVTGWVCKVKDSSSLAEAYIKCINTTPDQRVSMGAAGRTLVEKNYSMDEVLTCYRNTIVEYTNP